MSNLDSTKNLEHWPDAPVGLLNTHKVCYKRYLMYQLNAPILVGTNKLFVHAPCSRSPGCQINFVTFVCIILVLSCSLLCVSFSSSSHYSLIMFLYPHLLPFVFFLPSITQRGTHLLSSLLDHCWIISLVIHHMIPVFISARFFFHSGGIGKF